MRHNFYITESKADKLQRNSMFDFPGGRMKIGSLKTMSATHLAEITQGKEDVKL